VPEQKISVKNALIAYIQGGAFSSKEENIKGRIMAIFLLILQYFLKIYLIYQQMKFTKPRYF